MISRAAAWLFRGPGSMADEAEALAHGSVWGIIASILFVALLVAVG